MKRRALCLVEQASKLELPVTLKSAKWMRIPISQSLLFPADEVVQ